MSLITFHGNPELKKARIAQVCAHRKADQLIHGKYWEDGKGCAVGCTVHSGDHSVYERELGIPIELAYLEDRIFEELPNGKAMLWPERFLESIPVGVDLRATSINKRFVLALYADPTRGLIARTSYDSVRKAAQETAPVLEQLIRDPRDEGARKRLAWRADLADLADLAYRAYLADRVDRADLADRAYRADLADLAYRADLADLPEILLEVLAASAASTSSPMPSAAEVS